MNAPSRDRPARPGSIRLARRIVALASSGGWSSGRHITEAELVEALAVSRTPIRSALKLLGEAGIVEARQNQGFFLVRDGSGLALFEPEHVPTAVEDLYRRMLRDRMSELLGQQVTPAALAERYGVGRTILGQALARLAEDGLLFRGDGRSWRFVETLTDGGSIRASYEFRLAIEPAGLRSGTFQGSREMLTRLLHRHDALVERLRDGSRPPVAPSASLRTLVVGLDADFHEGLASLSGNPFVTAAVKQQVALRRLMEFGLQEQVPRIQTWCHEHRLVIEALLDGNRRRASLLLSSHLRNALARLDGESSAADG